MPDLAAPLQEALEALDSGRNLHEVLRRQPAQRDALISLLKVSVELKQLRVPGADTVFRLSARNRLLAAAARAKARRATPAGFFERLALRPRLALAATVALVAALGLGATVAAAGSLPGEPLYALKTGSEQVALAVTVDPAANARLRLEFADRRLVEAQRLVDLGQVQQAIILIDQYEAAVSRVDRALSATPLTGAPVADLARFLEQDRQQADARLDTVVKALTARGNLEAADAVAHARSHADETLNGRRQVLQTHSGLPPDQVHPIPPPHPGSP